jgi:phosphoglycerate dehydrogenase-like enzyme
LAGRTLGLLGLGNIGAAMARIGQAFGMKVIAWSQNLTAERAASADAELVTKEEPTFRVTANAIFSELLPAGDPQSSP